MPRPLSPEALEGFLKEPAELLDWVVSEMAADETTSVSITFADRDSRRRYMVSLYNARRDARKRAKKEFDINDPNWGKSPWETIRFWTEESGGYFLLMIANKSLEGYGVIGGEVR